MSKNIVKIVAGGMIVSAVLTGNTSVPYNVMKGPIVLAATNAQGVPKPPVEVISLQNGSFEQPAVSYGTWKTLDQSEVPGWNTTGSDGLIEIQNHFENREAADGEQYVELNAYEASGLYQDIITTPGAKVRWRVAHRGRLTTDTATVKFGTPDDLKIIETMTTSKEAWKTYSGTYTIPAGQTTTRFQFEAVGGDPRNGNLLDNIVFATQSFITLDGKVDQTSVKENKIATYSFDAKNEGGMASQNTELSILISEEVTLVSSDVMVDGVSIAGSYDSSTRTLSIPLESVGEGATKHVTFDVKGAVVADDITTQATVTHQDQGFTDEDYINYSNDVTLKVIANHVPTIEASDHTVKKGGTFNPLTDVSAVDQEDGNLTSSVKVTENDVDTSQVGTYHVTYSVTDSDGNVTTKTIAVTVTSNDAPVINATDVTLKKGEQFVPTAGVSASDTEDGDVTADIQVTANDVDTTQVGTYHVTYSVTDSDGNTTTKTITVTVTSNDAPVITAANKTVKKGGTLDLEAGVSATDAEDGNLTSQITITANDVDTSKVGTYHVTYSVTDSDGNTTTKTITVTVTSNDAPVITAANKTVKKGGTLDLEAGVSATDTEDGNLTSQITITANDVDTSKVGTYHVTYSVTDSDGNTTTKTITVIVTSNDAPVITAANKTVKKGGTLDLEAGVSATDTEDGNLTSQITITANDVDTSKVGTYHVTYSVTDSDGNTTTKTITVTVTSNDAPVISATDQTLKKGGTFSPYADVTASDTEDGDMTLAVEVTANDVDTSKVGTYHVTYSATDSDGNTTTKTITVTVTSNDAPVIQASNITMRVNKAFDVNNAVTASDTEDGDITSKIQVTANNVNVAKAGVYHVTYSVTDSDNNTTTKTITVTVLTDDAPILTTSDVYLKVGDTFEPLAGITANDTEDGNLTNKIKVETNTVDMTQAGTYAVSYSVTDSDGNKTTIQRHVYVRTNDKPVIHATDQTFKAGHTFDPMAGMSASDTEDGDVTGDVTITANDVDATQAGTYHVTYSVKDSDNNVTTKTITVTVLTNEKPVITASDITQKAHRSLDPLAGVSAEDLEDGDLTSNIQVVANDVNIDVPGEYHITY
ncbi:putative peptidoglycan linked protein, partial [Listeria grandensis FSL F6-0971]